MKQIEYIHGVGVEINKLVNQQLAKDMGKYNLNKIKMFSLDTVEEQMEEIYKLKSVGEDVWI